MQDLKTSMLIKEKLIQKYIAIRPKGFNHYIWFKKDKVNNACGSFIGLDGWGKGGAFTSIECDENEIKSIIYSDELQY